MPLSEYIFAAVGADCGCRVYSDSLSAVTQMPLSEQIFPARVYSDSCRKSEACYPNATVGAGLCHVEPSSNTIEPGGKKMCLFTSAEPPEVAQLSPYKARKARS